MAMVRKQVYIEPEQERFLKRRARELGVTEAELIRRGIQEVSGSGAIVQPYDPEAWAAEVAFMEERARLPKSGTPWKFNRDEVYEERIDKIASRLAR